MDTDDNLGGDYQVAQDDYEIREAFTKLYKKLAIILHPLERVNSAFVHLSPCRSPK